MGTVRSSTTDSENAEYYEYDVFGKPYGENVSDYAYTGKPYDPVTGMYNYGYRDYVPQTARFTTIDPIRDGNNWFAYCNNEPVNFQDAWGLKPGDVFSSLDEVAADFGTTYNDDSIRYNKEYGATIYKVDGGYTYTTPATGSNDGVIMSVPSDAKVEGYLHTHAAYDPYYGDGNNNFSDTDKNTATKKKVVIYVATPDGSLKEYDPITGKTRIVSKNMPTDPSTGSDDETIGFWENLWDQIVNFFTGNAGKDDSSSNEDDDGLSNPDKEKKNE